MTHGFTLPGDDGSRVSVHVIGYENESAANPDDANWLRAVIDVAHGGLEGHQPCALMTYDFVAFRDSLVSMIAGRSQSSRFTTDEEWLELEISSGPRGNVDVKGRLRGDAGPDSGMEFSLSTNLPEIERVLGAIESLLEATPVRHMP